MNICLSAQRKMKTPFIVSFYTVPSRNQLTGACFFYGIKQLCILVVCVCVYVGVCVCVFVFCVQKCVCVLCVQECVCVWSTL